MFLAVVIGYVFCPLDLIPDLVSILGYLDDLILVQFGIYIALRLIPSEIMDECRKKAQEEKEKSISVGKKITFFIILLWILGIVIMALILINLIEFVQELTA